MADEDKWERKADMPTRRHGLVACSVNRKIYTIGGGIRPINPPIKWYEYLPLLEVYDPVADSWTTKSPMSTPRMYLSAVAMNGRIYAIGGGNGVDEFYPAIEEYDPAIDKWTKKSDMPTARAGLCSIVVGNEILAIGGIGESWQALPTMEGYDPVTDTWSKKPDMPTPRHFFSVSAVSGKFYFFGGQTGPFAMDGPFLSLVEEYDPAAETWARKADMPTSRAGLETCAVNGEIYTIGGMVEGREMVSIVEKYDPSRDIWSKAADMSVRRVSMSVGVVNGRIYAIGGSSVFPFESLPIVEEYTPEI
jgi:N-acetylneuraminic acid mutarotase